MAQGQTVIRNIKGIAAAVERQEFLSIANFLEKNQKAGEILFGDTPETHSNLLGLIQVLRNGALDDKQYFINFINDRVSEHIKQSSILLNQSPQRRPAIIRSGEPLADTTKQKKKTANLFNRILEVGASLRDKLTFKDLSVIGATAIVATLAAPNFEDSLPKAKAPLTSTEIQTIAQPNLSFETAIITPNENRPSLSGAINRHQDTKEAFANNILENTKSSLASQKVETAFNDHGVDGLYQENGQIMYHDWTVSQDVYEANLLASKATGLPQSYLYAVQSVESSLNEQAINGIKACGLTQFVPDTLDYMTYEFASDIGFDGAENFIERYNTKGPKEDPVWGYRHTSPFSENTLMAMCWNAQFNVMLGSVNKIIDLGKMQKSLAKFAPEGMDYYPVTQLHGYVAVFAGGNGGTKLLRDLVANSGNSHAIKFFSSAARKDPINAKLLYHPHTVVRDGKKVIEPNMKNPRTVTEFYALIKNERGLSDEVLPDFRDWRHIVSNIDVKLTDLGIPRQQITKVIAPQLRTDRPQSRPASLTSTMQTATSTNADIQENKRSAPSESPRPPRIPQGDMPDPNIG